MHFVLPGWSHTLHGSKKHTNTTKKQKPFKLMWNSSRDHHWDAFCACRMVACSSWILWSKVTSTWSSKSQKTRWVDWFTSCYVTKLLLLPFWSFLLLLLLFTWSSLYVCTWCSSGILCVPNAPLQSGEILHEQLFSCTETNTHVCRQLHYDFRGLILQDFWVLNLREPVEN